MQQVEFEALTGKKVSAEQYAEIEKVYMAAYAMDKQEFCAAWKAGETLHIMGELVKNVQSLTKWRDNWKKQMDEAEEKAKDAAYVLLNGADEHNDESMKEAAINLVGLAAVVRFDVENGFKLSDEERSYILNNI